MLQRHQISRQSRPRCVCGSAMTCLRQCTSLKPVRKAGAFRSPACERHFLVFADLADQLARCSSDGETSGMPKRWLVNVLESVLTLLVTLVLVAGLFELGVRLFVDDGMNFNLEMWKYARDVKQRSANPLIGHEHRPFAQ